MRMKLDADELTQQNDKLGWKSGTLAFLDVRLHLCKKWCLSLKVFIVMTQKENLMKDCLARKNDPDGTAEKTNKRVQGRETITEPCYKNSSVVTVHEKCKSLGSEIRC